MNVSDANDVVFCVQFPEESSGAASSDRRLWEADYDEIWSDICLHRCKQQECVERGQAASGFGRGGIVSHYSGLARFHKDEIDRLQRQAAALVVKSR